MQYSALLEETETQFTLVGLAIFSLDRPISAEILLVNADTLPRQGRSGEESTKEAGPKSFLSGPA